MIHEAGGAMYSKAEALAVVSPTEAVAIAIASPVANPARRYVDTQIPPINYEQHRAIPQRAQTSDYLTDTCSVNNENVSYQELDPNPAPKQSGEQHPKALPATLLCHKSRTKSLNLSDF